MIGIHTPELAIERNPDNVAAAIKERGLTYPIGLDDDFGTWNAYKNRYWPSTYLIDSTGRLRYAHLGEGRYRRTEAAIRWLIAEADVSPAPARPERGSPSATRATKDGAVAANALMR